MHSLTEPEIIEKAIEGDTRAFQRLVEMHQGFAYSLSYRLVGNKVEAEDIVQEVFIGLWKKINTYKKGMKLRTWLYTIVTNRCLDFLRSQKGKQRSDHADIENAYALSGSLSSDHSLDHEELTKAVFAIADTLTPKQRAVFVLRDLEDLSVDEVGGILSMSAGNIKSNLYYARLEVSKKLKMYYKESEKRTL